MDLRIVPAMALFAAANAFAQLAPKNDAGVTLGHIHLAVKDVAVQQEFWTTLMGGTAVKNGPLSLIQIPGVFIMLRQAEPTGPPAGSLIDHFGIVVKDLPGYRARWKAANLKFDESENPNSGYINGPDGIRVEAFGDTALSVPIRMNHIHFQVADIPGLQAWYVKTFGLIASQRACVSCVKNPRMMETANLPGAINLSISAGKDKVGTKGRSLDHIGFEVKDLDAFVAKLEGQGTKLDSPIRAIANTKLKIAFLTDPWGTYIELTENLAP